MTKILNLDELETPNDKHIILKGKKHLFTPFSVGKFIEQLKSMESYSSRPDVPVSEYIEHMVTMVASAFPTIEAEDLKELTVEKIRMISDFIQGRMQEEVAEGIAADPDAAPKN